MQKRSSTFAVSGGHVVPAWDSGSLPSDTAQSPHAQYDLFGLPRPVASRPRVRLVDGFGVTNMARVAAAAGSPSRALASSALDTARPSPAMASGTAARG